MTPYEILGVAEGASLDEINAAYREKAGRYHPDAGGDAWAFRQLEHAYSQLTNRAEPHDQCAAEHPPTPDDVAVSVDQPWEQAGYVVGGILVVVLAILAWWNWLWPVLRVVSWLVLATSSGGIVYLGWLAWEAREHPACGRTSSSAYCVWRQR
jgi:hypothetical protein